MMFYFFAKVVDIYPTLEHKARVSIEDTTIDLILYSDYRGRHAVEHRGVVHLLADTPIPLEGGVSVLIDSGEIGFFYDRKK